MRTRIFFIKDGIIYDTIYGCSKKYQFENSMWILSALVFTYRVIIYICIYAPDLGRRKIDDINGSDKIYLKQKMFMIGTEESNN